MKNHYIPAGVIFILFLFVVPSAIPMTRSNRGDTLVVNKIPTVYEKKLYDCYHRYQIIDYYHDKSKFSTYVREKEMVTPSVTKSFIEKSSFIL